MGTLWTADLHQHGAVCGDLGRKGAVELAEVLLLPEVTHRQAAGQAEVGPACGHGGSLPSPVEEADGGGAVPEGACPHLAPAVEGASACRPTQRVLVDVEHLVVGE